MAEADERLRLAQVEVGERDRVPGVAVAGKPAGPRKRGEQGEEVRRVGGADGNPRPRALLADHAGHSWRGILRGEASERHRNCKAMRWAGQPPARRRHGG